MRVLTVPIGGPGGPSVAHVSGTPISPYPCGSCSLFFTVPFFFEIRKRKKKEREREERRSITRFCWATQKKGQKKTEIRMNRTFEGGPAFWATERAVGHRWALLGFFGHKRVTKKVLGNQWAPWPEGNADGSDGRWIGNGFWPAAFEQVLLCVGQVVRARDVTPCIGERDRGVASPFGARTRGVPRAPVVRVVVLYPGRNRVREARSSASSRS